VFFKYMVKTLAEQHEIRATFMPKPFADLTGNGCHAHVSVWNKDGAKNLFLDKNDKQDLGLSKLAYDFLGGIIHNAEALTAIFNPTVNSYKRINGALTRSGATWSPNTVTYSGNNRTHMIRVPDDGRFELRLKPHFNNMYAEPEKAKGAKKLPLNLLDAIRLLDKSKPLRLSLGDDLIDAYVKLRMQDWHAYTAHLSEWERANTLDC